MAKKTKRKSGLYKATILGVSLLAGYIGLREFCKHGYENLPVRHVGKKLVEKMIGNDPSGKGDLRDKYEHRNIEDYTRAKPENQYRITILGESTSWGVSVSREETYAFRLQTNLKDHYQNTDILVLNAGRSGSVVEDGLLNYILNEKWFEPNLLIPHFGVNNGVSSVYGGYIKEKIDINPRYGEKLILTNSLTSPIAKYIDALWLNKNTQTARVSKKLIDIAEDPNRVKEALKLANQHPKKFYEDLRTLTQLAKINGSEVLLFPIPIRPYNLFENEGFEVIRELVPTAIESNKRATIKIAEEEETHYLELNPEEIPADYFGDNWHMTKEGHALKAQALANYIIQQKFIDKWIAERENKEQQIREAKQKTLENSLDPNYKTPNNDETLHEIHEKSQKLETLETLTK
jgi:lysophospholipase L1-like esterase